MAKKQDKKPEVLKAEVIGKKYKVEVIQISLKNNKLANFDTIVDEDQLSSEADDLVKGGYISLIK